MTTTTSAAPVLRTRIVLSANAFTVLWEKLGLGALPRALFLPSPGATTGARAGIEHLAAAELTRLGFGAGPADHELVAALRLLATPAVEYYGWCVPATGHAFGVCAATSGRAAVVSTLDGATVALWPAGHDDLARAVTNRLPPARPAAGPPVPLAEYARTAFERATGGTVTGNGQLFVAVRDRLGRRARHGPVEYVDTARGRWLVRRSPALAVPGSPDVIAGKLDGARRLLAGRNGRA